MKLLLAMSPTILLVVYSQLITKWRVQLLGGNAPAEAGRWGRAFAYLSDPYVISAYVAALVGSITWMFVVERYAISVAFPIYIGLTVMFVVVAGMLVFGEDVTPMRVLAIVFILVGVAIGSRS
jgi:multidrug transporter EmrE-like cation transporter